MSFLQELKEVKRKGLKNSGTTIRTCDGAIYKESFNPKTGKYETAKTGEEAFGWVGDTKPDLQLAEVMPNLYFGSQDVASDLKLLKQNEITHILNLTPNVENFFPKYLTYFRIPILDVPETDISQHFSKSNDFIFDALSSGGTVFVHCNAGVSRSSTVVAAYCMKIMDLSFDTVMAQLKAVRPCVCPNNGFKKQLILYEQSLKLYKPNS